MKKKSTPFLPLRGKILLSFCVILGSGFLTPSLSCAQEKIDQKLKTKFKSFTPRYNTPSTNLTGMLGVNTIPSARMDEVGTVRLGVGTSDPYLHAYMGFQLAESFYVSVRQTAESSSLTKHADNLYPGVDIKLRLVEETATRPAVVVGLDSAVGHARMGSEYVALSKRYNNFDFTGGIGWGRLGSAGHLKNPMRKFSSHFDKNRNFNNLFPQEINDWFTGENIGFFGGLEYHTPIKGLSLKTDYGANDYIGEQAIDGFNAPAPWSVGLNYKPWEQIDLSAGIIGGEKIMARLSLQDQIYNWPGKNYSKTKPPEIIAPRVVNENNSKFNIFNLFRNDPIGRQVGRQARLIANHSPVELESLEIKIRSKGLKGPDIKLIRRDLEAAVINNNGSPEEIWQDTVITSSKDHLFNFDKILLSDLKQKPDFKFILENSLSLSEQDTGPLYRTSGIVEIEKEFPAGFNIGTAMRLNIANNLDRLRNTRLISDFGIRSNEVDFAKRRIAVERSYINWMKTILPDTHLGLTMGYLEEMFSGYGGELLYRPYGKTFGIGIEGWKIYKRDPSGKLNLDLFKEPTFTGHLNLFYEVPNKDVTFFAKAGQYLGTDRGASFGVRHRFDNGAQLEGLMTITDLPFQDLFGDKTHMYGGIKLSLPLGNIPYVPNGSEIQVKTEPFSRDSGQLLDKPLPLYEITEPIASRQLQNSWKTLLD